MHPAFGPAVPGAWGEAEKAVSQTGGRGGSGMSLTSPRDASCVTFKTLQRRRNRAARQSPDTLQQPVLALLATASAGKRAGDCYEVHPGLAGAVPRWPSVPHL